MRNEKCLALAAAGGCFHPHSASSISQWLQADVISAQRLLLVSASPSAFPLPGVRDAEDSKMGSSVWRGLSTSA